MTNHGSLVKKMKVDELVTLGGVVPPEPDSPPGVDVVAEILQLYYEIYAPGLTMFFESDWYDSEDTTSAKNTTSILRNNKYVLNLFATFLKTISDVKTTDPRDMVYSGHLETSLVWALARLPFTSSTDQIGRLGSAIPAEDDETEVRNRLIVFEILLSGDQLASNPLTAPPLGTGSATISTARASELEFWYQLAQYILQTPGSPSLKDESMRREQCLGRIRAVLDGHENRDVLYSIAVLREYAPLFDPVVNERTVPAHLDEMDPRHKLAVATRFIREEAANTGGTTNVVRRFAELANRAFIQPGVNVVRNPPTAEGDGIKT